MKSTAPFSFDFSTKTKKKRLFEVVSDRVCGFSVDKHVKVKRIKAGESTIALFVFLNTERQNRAGQKPRKKQQEATKNKSSNSYKS